MGLVYGNRRISIRTDTSQLRVLSD